MRGRERREGMEEEVGRRRGEREGAGRAVEGRAEEGREGMERTTLCTPCHKFLATSLTL